MKVQINSDRNVKADAQLTSNVRAEIERALDRFTQHLTRVEVHLSDANSGRGGARDKACLLEARPAGKQPVSVRYASATVEDAVKGAVGKMKRLLETSVGRTAHQTSRESLRAGKRTVTSAGTLEKLGRIEAALTDLLHDSNNYPPEIVAHVRAATNSLHKAQLVRADRAEPPMRNGPGRSAAPAPTKHPYKKAAPATGRVAVDGRSPKKKGAYRARRKSWPKR